MTNANECTCPSGNGSLRHPCPAHPAVEQAGGDEGAAFFKHLIGRHPAHETEIVRVVEHNYAAWKAWQARAALAQPSPSQGDEKPGDSILCYGCFAKGVGPEHFDEAGKCLVRQQTEPLGAEFAQVLSDNLPELLSTAQAEKAEGFTHFPELLESVQQMDAMLKANSAQPEQPEVVGYLLAKGNGTLSILRAGSSDEPVMTVAQHERIVGELRAVIAQLRQHKNDYMDAGQETYRALQNEIREREAEIARLDGLVSGRTAERDAALARVAELEKQEPVATIAKVPGEDWNGLHFYRDLQGMQPGTKLYAAPVAQAQHGTGYAEARQCVNCRHIGINDAADYAACHDCNWTGPEPDEDKCPGCAGENCMAAACPECGGRYELVAEAKISTPAAQAGQMPQAWLDVQAERRRQITAEGWTPEHDDEHSHGQIARAAACYALAGSSAPNDGTAALLVSLAWPWDQQWWKPTSARRDLIKAGALILAEIERLDRAAERGKEGL
ncbi:hypothetical protein ACEPX9_09440 [Pseudomonas aeruginosa]